MVNIKYWHILSAIALVLAALFAWRIEASNRLVEARENLQSTAKIAERIALLRSRWENNQAAKSKATQLFNEEAFKKAGGATTTQAGIKAELKGLDAQALNRLTRQILESPVQLKTFSIERKGDMAADANLEISW